MKRILLMGLVAALGACSAYETARQSGAKHARIGQTKTVVFVHGMYLTPKCWDEWKKHFEARGYTVHAPAWPLHDLAAAARRAKHPEPALARLTLDQVIESYRTFLSGLPEKPIAVGHSMGGLISQILLGEGRVVAAIAIDSAPPKGVVSQATALRHGFSFVRAAMPIVSPFASDDDPIEMTAEGFAWAFANGLSPADQQRGYTDQAGPESRRVGRGALTKSGAVMFDRKRGPLLLVAGETDRIIPPSVVRLNYEEYEKDAGLTEFRQFAGRPHFIIGAPKWEEVADFTLQWIESNR